MPRRRTALKAFLPISDILSRNVFGQRGATLVGLYQLRKCWGEIVGETLSEKTWPKKIQRQTLTVSTENPVWAQQLSMMKEEMLESIWQKTGQKFSDVRFLTENLPAQRAVIRS